VRAKTGLAQVTSRCQIFYILLALPLSLFFYLETTPEAQSFFAGYSGESWSPFLRGLKQRGLMDNSLIVICADHGEELYDMGGVYHGWQINPWVMHVPLFIHYPVCVPATAPPPNVLSRPVNLIDLAPTICQTMGVEIVHNSRMQGLSLLEPEPAEPRSFLLLSWKNPVVGEMSFSPCRMRVLDLDSGEEQTYAPAKSGWVLSAGPSAPQFLAEQLGQALGDLFVYWQMSPSNGEARSSQTSRSQNAKNNPNISTATTHQNQWIPRGTGFFSPNSRSTNSS
jgi:Sulfatase